MNSTDLFKSLVCDFAMCTFEGIRNCVFFAAYINFASHFSSLEPTSLDYSHHRPNIRASPGQTVVEVSPIASSSSSSTHYRAVKQPFHTSSVAISTSALKTKPRRGRLTHLFATRFLILAHPTAAFIEFGGRLAVVSAFVYHITVDQ